MSPTRDAHRCVSSATYSVVKVSDVVPDAVRCCIYPVTPRWRGHCYALALRLRHEHICIGL